MYYGFDIGGSKIALGVFDKSRRLQWEKRVATPKESYEAFLQAVEELVEEADQRFGCGARWASVFRACRRRKTARSTPPTCPPPAAGGCGPI